MVRGADQAPLVRAAGQLDGVAGAGDVPPPPAGEQRGVEVFQRRGLAPGGAVVQAAHGVHQGRRLFAGADGILMAVGDFPSEQHGDGAGGPVHHRRRIADEVRADIGDHARLAPGADDLIVGGRGPHGSVGVCHVGDGHDGRPQIGFDLLEPFLRAGDLFLERPPFGDQRVAPGLVLLAFGEPGDLVLALLDGLGFVNELLAVVVQRDDAVDVGGDVAVLAVRFDCVEVVADELGIEHGESSFVLAMSGCVP